VPDSGRWDSGTRKAAHRIGQLLKRHTHTHTLLYENRDKAEKLERGKDQKEEEKSEAKGSISYI
jgi:hypothetical protein